MNEFDFDLQRFADRVISGDNYTITAGGTYKVAGGFTGTITIDTTATVTIDGTNAGALTDVKIFAKSSTANLTIKNLTVTNETDSVIRFGSGTGNKLTLAGTNSLKTSDTWAAVVNVGGGLTIGGSGSLNVTAGTQGSGIGINSYDDSTANIIINGGTITATADMGAGIGSGSNGSIGNITINAVSVNTTSIWGKGVGAGYGGSAGNVTITIVGDVGDDILIGTPETDTFAYTGGNDVITNYGSEDTVHIKSGKIDGYSFEGSDLIFHIGNGSLRLNNMTNHAITVKDSAGKTTTQVYGTGYSGHEVMKRFVHSMANSKLDTKAKLDEAIKACSHFNSLQEVIDKLISDLENSDDAESFLQKYCGIFYGNADNGAVIGWDVGGLRVKTEDDILPTDYSNSYPTLTTFTKRGLTLTVPAKNTLTEEEQRVVQKIYSADMEDAIKLIEETYEFKFTDKPLTLPLYLVHQPGNAPAWAGVSGITANLSNGGDNPAYYLSHELTHVAQQHFGFFDHMPNFMFEGMADLTAGGDVRGALALVGNPSRLAQYLNLNNNSDVDPYTSGVIFWRYLMRQASDSYDSSKNYSWKDNSHISGTANGELLTGSGTNVTIVAGAGNDTLTVYGKNMKAFGEEGADCILIGSLASGASIDGGLGNDSIDNSGSNVTINGGAGNDTIENYGNKVTLDGGTGSDSINSKGDSVKIFGGADNDIILVEKTSDYNWDIEAWVDTYHDKATIDGGLGNDSIKNENSNASINGGAGNDSINTYGSNVTINGGAGNDSINTYGSNVTISGGAGNDSINSKGNSVKIFGGADNDIILVEKTSDYNWDIEAWADTYHDKATIDGGTGNDSIKNENSNVSINGGTGNDSIENYGNKVTLDGGAGNDTINSKGGSVKIVGGVGSNSINSKGDSVKIFGGADNDIILVEKTSDYNWDIEVWEFTYHDKATIDGGTGNDSIKNENSNASINGGTGNDTIENHGDKTILQGGAGSDMLINGEYFSSGGVKVSISGGDGNDTLTNSGSNSVLYGGAGNDLIHNGYYYYRDWNIYYDSSSGGEYNDSLKSSNVSIDGGSGNDSIDNRGSNVSLNGGAGNDTITNYGNNVTIAGGKGNDTLTGGKGADVFVYTAGKDVISDYASGDKISLGAAISATAVSGSNVVFTIGKGKLTVKDAKDKKLTLINSAGKSSTTTISDLQTVINSTKSPVTAKSYVKTINASKRTKAVSITGNALANTITGGTKSDSLYGGSGNDIIHGGKGNDSLVGGKGNDRLWGDAGKDTFIYSSGDGKDVIYGFENNDLLQISGKFSARYNSSTNSIAFKVGSTANAITLRDFGSTTTFNVNNTPYHISGSKLVKS